jgi:hypothetical protein
MSSVIDPHPEQPAAEELVAYLDGELPPDECRRVEERLGADAAYRQQLRDLDQAWEALDALPTRRANDDFARTTMELVTVAAQADATAVTATAAGANRRRMAWFTAAGLAGALMGFVLAWLLLPSENRALLQDLPVIRRAETLRQIENVDFLRRLAAEVPAERLMHDDEALENEMDQLAAISSPSLDTRREWIENLSAEERVVLADQAKRFSLINPVKQEELRKLSNEVSAEGAQLQRSLLAYEQWLSQLTSWQQEELREEFSERTTGEQVEFVKQLVQQERDRASQKLSADDADKLRQSLRKIAAERQAELAADRRRRGDDDDRGRTILVRALWRNDEESSKIRDQLTMDLSPEAQARLNSLSGRQRNFQLWRWIREALPRKVDPHQLERFFVEKLEARQREQLLSLPANEMQSRLEQLYFATEGYGNPAEWMDEFREPGLPPNRPGPGGPGFRPDGPPRDRDRRGPDFRERDGRPRGPDSPPRPREDDPRDGRRPLGPPPNGPRRDGPGPGPPPDGPPPRDGERPPKEI